MASEFPSKHDKYSKQVSHRKVIYYRFFVGLLLFILLSLLVIVGYAVWNGSGSRSEGKQPISLRMGQSKKLAEGPGASKREVTCTYWDCFDVYRCGRGGHRLLTIYIYPLIDYRTEDDLPVSHLSREFYDILNTIKNSKYYTSDPEEACLLVPSIDTLNQYYFSSTHVSRALQSLKQ